MVRAGMITLGIGLVVLWAVGLSRDTADWFLWLSFLVGILSVIGGALAPRISRNARVTELLAFAGGLFVLWVIGMVSNLANWEVWSTFAFACAYLLFGIAVGSSERTPTMHPTAPRPV